MCAHVVVAVGDPLPKFTNRFGHDGVCIDSCHHILKIGILLGIMYDLVDNFVKLGSVFLQGVGRVQMLVS